MKKEENALPKGVRFIRNGYEARKTVNGVAICMRDKDLGQLLKKFEQRIHEVQAQDSMNAIGLSIKTTLNDFFDYWFDTAKVLELSHLDTSQVTSMAEMFAGCYRLISLDLSNLDTSNVKDMSGMFYGCGHLTKLNLSKFNTTNVECMSDMFRGCERLTALDLPNFDISKVTNMAYMFCGCRSLTALGLSNFDVSKITDMMGMFDGCVSLTEECKSRLKAQGFTVMW